VVSGHPEQGEVFWADPDPTRGSEQARSRPFAIVSADQLNRSPLKLSLVVPLTRTDFANPLHVAISPPEGGLKERSFAMPEQLRAVSQDRLVRRLGRLRSATLEQLRRHCRVLLG
jgi:mRNA interferase MazF